MSRRHRRPQPGDHVRAHGELGLVLGIAQRRVWVATAKTGYREVVGYFQSSIKPIPVPGAPAVAALVQRHWWRSMARKGVA